MISYSEAELINSVYAPLFRLMSQEHKLILLVEEMNDIINAVEEVNINFKKKETNG